jgi:hypothetical protein
MLFLCFVDIDRIVDLHCLNFLFIKHDHGQENPEKNNN